MSTGKAPWSSEVALLKLAGEGRVQPSCWPAESLPGAGYTKGIGPYHVGARLFVESVLQRLNVVRSSTILAGLADDNEA